MRTNTSAALRTVEDIDDPLEVATREIAQVEAEKAEINAKLQELRSAKAEDDAIVSSGDHRKITDELLVRGMKYERGIAAMERALEVAEERRLTVQEGASQIRRVRDAAKARADVEATAKEIEKADADFAAASGAFAAACAAREEAFRKTFNANQVAAQYGIPADPPRSTRDLLAELLEKHGLLISSAGQGRRPGVFIA